MTGFIDPRDRKAWIREHQYYEPEDRANALLERSRDLESVSAMDANPHDLDIEEDDAPQRQFARRPQLHWRDSLANWLSPDGPVPWQVSALLGAHQTTPFRSGIVDASPVPLARMLDMVGYGSVGDLGNMAIHGAAALPMPYVGQGVGRGLNAFMRPLERRGLVSADIDEMMARKLGDMEWLPRSMRRGLIRGSRPPPVKELPGVLAGPFPDVRSAAIWRNWDRRGDDPVAFLRRYTEELKDAANTNRLGPYVRD